VADVFISYANADRPLAQALADSLARQGWRVFWDRHLPPGQPWLDVLRRELSDASCVLVLVTRHALASDWVLFEAGQGLQRNNLVPLLADATLDPQRDLPEPYRDVHLLRIDPSAAQAPDGAGSWLPQVGALVRQARRRRAVRRGALALAGVCLLAGLLALLGVRHNAWTLLAADLWHVERGAYSLDENERLKRRIREAALIEVLVPNATSLTSALREDLGVFMQRDGSRMRVILADGHSEFYGAMMAITHDAVARSGEASAADRALPERSRQVLRDLAGKGRASLVFRRFGTEFRLPMILIDRTHCFVTVRLTPDQAPESLRLEFSDTAGGTSGPGQWLAVQLRRAGQSLDPRPLQAGYVESCRRHFDAVWDRSRDFDD
jgi:hypothetical protein